MTADDQLCQLKILKPIPFNTRLVAFTLDGWREGWFYRWCAGIVIGRVRTWAACFGDVGIASEKV